jgi:phage host-nuclease inhibitor protein Gam
MKTRNAKKRMTEVSAAQFEDAMSKYALAENREAEINRNIEEEVKEVIEKYEDELMCLAQGKQIAFDMVQAYCLNNKETLFNNKRSIGTLHGIAGFRLGTPRLKTVKGTDWKQALTRLKDKLPEYVRTVEEPAKDLLLADRNKEHVAPLLIEIG